jgi:iron-sulfur cluster repair protein YtfE (RIC family)
MQMNTINERYTEDHLQLHAQFHRFQALKAIDPEAAREAFLKFKTDLERHILWEERILFPCFEHKYNNVPHSPIAILHREHEQILVCLDDIEEKLSDSNFATEKDERNIEESLLRHNAKEEVEFFPALDFVLDDDERAAIFRAMKARA